MDKLYVVRGKYEHLSLGLKDQRTYVGRSPENDIQIQDNYVSRKHLELYKKGGKYFIRDLNSSNGTFINDTMAAPNVPQPVQPGDTIRIAGLHLALRDPAAAEVGWRDASAHPLAGGRPAAHENQFEKQTCLMCDLLGTDSCRQKDRQGSHLSHQRQP